MKHLLLDLHSLALWPERKQIKRLVLDRNIAFLEAGSVIMLLFVLEWLCLENVHVGDVGLEELESRE